MSYHPALLAVSFAPQFPDNPPVHASRRAGLASMVCARRCIPCQSIPPGRMVRQLGPLAQTSRSCSPRPIAPALSISEQEAQRGSGLKEFWLRGRRPNQPYLLQRLLAFTSAVLTNRYARRSHRPQSHRADGPGPGRTR